MKVGLVTPSIMDNSLPIPGLLVSNGSEYMTD